MRIFAMLLFSLVTLTFLPSDVSAQNQQDQIDSRLDDVEELISEEEGTITVLEGQLKQAIDANDTEKADSLREEINSSFDSLDELKKLRKQLLDLRGDNPPAAQGNRGRGQKPRPGFGRRRGKVPTPSIGGSEGEVDLERERRRRDRDRANDNDRERGNPMFGGGRGQDRARGNGRDRVPGNNRNGDQRMRHLQDALDALLDAGETDLADDVQNVIDREERNLDRDRRERERTRDNDRARNRGNRAGRGDGPAMADGPSNPRPSNRGGNNARDRNPDKERDDLLDEIDRLRDRNKKLERERRGEDENNGGGNLR